MAQGEEDDQTERLINEGMTRLASVECRLVLIVYRVQDVEEEQSFPL